MVTGIEWEKLQLAKEQLKSGRDALEVEKQKVKALQDIVKELSTIRESVNDFVNMYETVHHAEFND